MKTLAVVIILAALACSATASGKNRPLRTCWRVKATFINYPSRPTSFARWRITQRGHVYAEGEFAFEGDAGGGYQRSIRRCLTGIDPYRTVVARLAVSLYVPCDNCDQFIAIRRSS